MFKPKTPKIEKICAVNGLAVKKLEKLLDNKVCMYIDYANVRPWATKLKWHISATRLKQFLDSFDNIEYIRFYQGTLQGDDKSEKEILKLKKNKFEVRTKPVKIMRMSIDATSVPADAPTLLNQFIRRALLRKYKIETIEYLNRRFEEMNKDGLYYIEDRKCNFDVELGVDMLLDLERNNIDTYVLWSGDSDFADPIKQLLDRGKNVILFATAGRIARELNALRDDGLKIFDIADIREYICWKREQMKQYK